MLKIQDYDGNTFERIKKFHKIKYLYDIRQKLINQKKLLNDKKNYSVKEFLEKLNNNLEDILIGEPKKIENIIDEIHDNYIKNKNFEFVKGEKNSTLKKFIDKTFDYKSFSSSILYNNSVIQDFKRNIKNRKRAGFSKREYNIIKLRNSIIRSIEKFENNYKGTKFDICDIAEQWKVEINKFNIADVNNICYEEFKIFDKMNSDLINKRNEFWGNYSEFKNDVTKKEIKEFWGAYNFVKEIGIMTCPYCNRVYTNLIIGKKKNYRPALDHFYPESKYPYLALSLFNLIPCCNICNSSFKSDSDKKINNLYDTGFENKYLFKYEKINESKKVTNSNIIIKIIPINEENDMMIDNNIELFEIQSAYTTHKDIVVEMCKQRERYSDSEIKRLIDSEIFTSRTDFLEQVILNGPIATDKFHQVPLAKFKRDIAYQLDFIKKYK